MLRRYIGRNKHMSTITKILKSPVKSLIPFRGTIEKWRFTELRLSSLFTDKYKIAVRSSLPNCNIIDNIQDMLDKKEIQEKDIKNDFVGVLAQTPFVAPLLNSLGLKTYGEAEALASSLNKLGIKEIFVKPDVCLKENIIAGAQRLPGLLPENQIPLNSWYLVNRQGRFFDISKPIKVNSF